MVFKSGEEGGTARKAAIDVSAEGPNDLNGCDRLAHRQNRFAHHDQARGSVASAAEMRAELTVTDFMDWPLIPIHMRDKGRRTGEQCDDGKSGDPASEAGGEHADVWVAMYMQTRAPGN